MAMTENSIAFVNTLVLALGLPVKTQLVLMNGFTIAVLASHMLQKVDWSAVNA